METSDAAAKEANQSKISQKQGRLIRGMTSLNVSIIKFYNF